MSKTGDILESVVEWEQRLKSCRTVGARPPQRVLG
mgnify:CR=1 FL=1